MQRLSDNQDYANLTRALNVLRYQLEHATNDIETLKRLKTEAIADPYAFVEQIKKRSLRTPKPQLIAPLPSIRWDKYGVITPPMRKRKRELKTPQTSTSLSSAHARFNEVVGQYKDNAALPSTRASSLDRSTECSDDAVSLLEDTRGKSTQRLRLATRAKIEDDLVSNAESVISADSSLATDTHKRAWSDKEQRRLEELLEIYPDEKVQARRFAKISEALGTRTPRQVASRIQKYFLKLAKHGLPVPGKVSNQQHPTLQTSTISTATVHEDISEFPHPVKKKANTRISGANLNIGPSIPRDLKEA